MKKRTDGRYEVKTTINGRRKSFYGYTKQEAMESLRHHKEEVDKGPLFSKLADEWEEAQEERVAYTTMKPYRTCVKRAQERFEGKHITEITPRDINNYILFIAQKGFAQKTVTNHLSVVTMIFRQAIIDGYIGINPAELIQVPAGLKKTPRELPSDEDIEKVKASADVPFGLLAYFAVYTGMRKGELLGLTYQDIDRTNRTISVSRSVYHVGTKPMIKEPKTEKGRRTVPLLDDLFKVLPDQQIGYVFPDANNGPLKSSTFETGWNRYRKSIGITCGLHQLRHAMATFCFEAGLDEKDTQDILGHADISTTKNIYTHIRESRRKLNADKLNKHLSSNSRQETDKSDSKA